MKIKWNGHACFTIKSDQGKIVFDPYANGSVPGLKPLRLKAHKILTSHDHSDHNAKEVVELIDSDINIKIDKINTYHDNQQGRLRGQNIINIVYLEEMKIVHFGDLGCDLTLEQQQKLQNSDVIMIPIGGYYTIDTKKALEIIEQIQPRIVIPMHYSSDEFGYDEISTIDEFKKKSKNVIEYQTDTLEVNKDTMKQTAILKLIV